MARVLKHWRSNLKENRTTIPGFSKYSIDLDTTHIYNSKGMKMKVNINQRGNKVASLVDNHGRRRSVSIDRIVVNTLKETSNNTEIDRILQIYYRELTQHTLEDHRTTWANRIKSIDSTLDKTVVLNVINRLQTGK